MSKKLSEYLDKGSVDDKKITEHEYNQIHKMFMMADIKQSDHKRLNSFCETLDEYKDISKKDKNSIIEDFKEIDAIYNEMIDKHYFGRNCVYLTNQFIIARLCEIRKITYDVSLEPKELISDVKRTIRNNFWHMICKRIGKECDYDIKCDLVEKKDTPGQKIDILMSYDINYI